MQPMTYSQHFEAARGLLKRSDEVSNEDGFAQLLATQAHVHAVIGASLLAAAAAGGRNTISTVRMVDLPGGAR